MRVNKAIRENLRFLVVEVGSQVTNLKAYLATGSPPLAQRILDRSGYAYNLKMRIHDGCVKQLSRGKNPEGGTLSLRAMESIATDLERIAELCRESIRQMATLEQWRCIDGGAYETLLERIGQGIELVEPAVEANDTRLALKLGDIERKVDRGYRKLQKGYIANLKRKKHTEDLISALFVAHSVEQMGDALLGIGESIISANLGQTLNISRYNALQESMARLEAGDPAETLHVEPIAETRSGSAISGIAKTDKGDQGYVAIYKDGRKRKLKEERQGVESWHEIYPGLAPRILSYHKRGQSAALLIEHLAGLTFEQILLHESPQLLAEALRQLKKTLRSVWRETRTRKAVSADFMGQTRQRMPEVYGIHSEFRCGDSSICGLDVPSFNQLLERACELEERLPPPFAVYIHGDFNVDNIIYDAEERRINFIDLHRSRYMDYVQDVSVFMVSNYRLQILDAPLRRRIMLLARDFYRFAREFARKSDDATFELRLALGLARSFATSTRFILDKSLARSMFLRARYLIEQVLMLDLKGDRKGVARYRVPIEEIFVG